MIRARGKDVLTNKLECFDQFVLAFENVLNICWKKTINMSNCFNNMFKEACSNNVLKHISSTKEKHLLETHVKNLCMLLSC